MDSKYTIPELIVIFKDHSMKSEEQKIEYRKKYGEPPYDDSFSMGEALSCICQEIHELKDKTHGISRISGGGVQIES